MCMNIGKISVVEEASGKPVRRKGLKSRYVWVLERGGVVKKNLEVSGGSVRRRKIETDVFMNVRKKVVVEEGYGRFTKRKRRRIKMNE